MNHVEGQVVFGDTKAGQLLAANSLLLAALAILAKDIRDAVSTATLALGIAAGFAVGASLVFVVISLAPSQTIPPNRGTWRNSAWDRLLAQRRSHRSETASLVHFVSIADASVESFMERAATATSDEIENDLLRAIHGKARWTLHKFIWIDRAVKALFVAILLIILAAVVEVLRTFA